MSAVRLRRGTKDGFAGRSDEDLREAIRKDGFAGRSDEDLREAIREVRERQRAIRRQHGGTRFRDEELAKVDQWQAEGRLAAVARLETLAASGDPRPLGEGAGPAISPTLRAAYQYYGLTHDDGFFDWIRGGIRTSPAFCDLPAGEMAALLEPLELEARLLAEELGRRHDERRELRERLRALEHSDA